MFDKMWPESVSNKYMDNMPHLATMCLVTATT